MVDNGEMGGVTPYWDTVLKHNRHVRIDFIKELASVCPVAYQLRIFCRAAIFFVAWKEDRIRMMIGGREASQ